MIRMPQKLSFWLDQRVFFELVHNFNIFSKHGDRVPDGSMQPPVFYAYQYLY
jgi:hypothetical protein